MGTYFSCGATKQDVVNELLEPLKANNHLVDAQVKSGDGEPVLWTVEKGERDGHSYQFIGCYVLRQAGGDWGYKPMDETMGPCFYSVPLEWLDKYPCVLPPANKGMMQYSKAWRANVRKFASQDYCHETLSVISE